MSEEDSQVTMVDFTKSNRFDGIATLEAYWQSVRGTRMVPLRSEIDPRGIENALDFAFIVERVTAGVVRFRLAGSQLNELMGMDVRGMPINAFFGSDSRSEMLTAIEGVFEGPEALEVALESPGAPGKPALAAQMILLPLKSDLGDISRAIGCLSTRGQMGRAPRRFDITGQIQRQALDGETTPLIDRRPAPVSEPTRDLLPGFAEPAAHFNAKSETPEGSDSRPSERPYLKLVRDPD